MSKIFGLFALLFCGSHANAYCKSEAYSFDLNKVTVEIRRSEKATAQKMLWEVYLNEKTSVGDLRFTVVENIPGEYPTAQTVQTIVKDKINEVVELDGERPATAISNCSTDIYVIYDANQGKRIIPETSGAGTGGIGGGGL